MTRTAVDLHPPVVDLSLYLVTDTDQAARAGRDLVETVLAAVAGGVTTVQLREKGAGARDALALLTSLSAQLPAHVRLLVNDRVDLLLAARARGVRVDGVHVGQSDLPVAEVRALVGADAVVGLTTRSQEQLREAEQSSARVDYVGIGAVRSTSSKTDAPPLGMERVVALAQATPLPAVAIGGITPDDLPGLRAGGLSGAAVVSWICAAADPRAAAQELATAWGIA